MVDDGGEFEELPFLEIVPAEELFDLMCNRNLHGKVFRSALFDRPIRIEFGLDPESNDDYGDPIECCVAWAKISANDPRCPFIKVGIDANANWIGHDCHYFDAGMTCYLSDDFPWDGLDRDQLLRLILEYIEKTIKYGFFEFWRGPAGSTISDDSRFRGMPISGPLRDHDRSRGWLKRAIQSEERAIQEATNEATSGWFGECLSWIIVVVLGILFSPIVIPALLIFGIPFLFRSKHPHALRYPPYPTE